MKNDIRVEALGRSSSGTFSSILLPIGPPAMPQVDPKSTSPRYSGAPPSGPMAYSRDTDATMQTQPMTTNGRFPILSAAFPIHMQKAREATAGISRYRPVPTVSRPSSIWR